MQCEFCGLEISTNGFCPTLACRRKCQKKSVRVFFKWYSFDNLNPVIENADGKYDHLSYGEFTANFQII